MLTLRGPWRLAAKRTVRTVNGAIRIGLDGEALAVTVRLPLEGYLAHVLAAEAAPWANVPRLLAGQYLAAQAVACRSYALFHLVTAPRHDGFDFCDSTHCQAFRDAFPGNGPVGAALALTRDLVLKRGDKIAPAFYSSTVPAVTVLPSEVWGDAGLDEFFQPVTNRLPGAVQALSAASPHARWEYRLPVTTLAGILENSFGFVWDGSLPGGIFSARGVLRALRFGRETVDGEAFRAAVCQATHWGTLRSLFLEIRREGEMIVCTGRGLGHGVGLCQYGALELARQGWSWRRILGFYYPLLEISPGGG